MLNNARPEFPIIVFPSIDGVGTHNQEQTNDRKYPIAGTVTDREMRIKSTYQIEDQSGVGPFFKGLKFWKKDNEHSQYFRQTEER